MATYGLTEAGFITPTFDDVLNDYTNALKRTFGADAATTEDTVFGQLIRILAYTDYTLWEGMQGVYNTQTLNGAEGIYLDEIFSKRGFYRKGAIASSGYAYVKTNEKASWTYQVDTATYFSSENDATYYVTTPTMLNSRIGAYTISKAQATALGVGAITFYMQNASTGGLNSITLDPQNVNFITSLTSFIDSNVSTTDQALVWNDTSNVYVGFLTTDKVNPVGLVTPMKFYATSNVGIKWSELPVESSEVGYNPSGKESVTGISSAFVGYLDSGNFYAFSNGSDIETDAEFRSRFNDNLDEANAATRPAIIKALLNTAGVTKVKIYDNNTLVDQPYAEACTFHTIVYGGIASEVARTIYDTKPINTRTYGSTAIAITTEDGGEELVHFSPGINSVYSLKLTYQTINNTVLTVTEKANIQAALKNLSAFFEIGSTVTNDQIKGAIYSALSFGRLTSLKVYVKLSSEDDSKYTETDIVPGFNAVPSFDLDNISYEYGV